MTDRDRDDARANAERLAHLAAVVDASSDAILSKRLDGTITSWNASAERIFGFSAQEIIGQNIRRLIPDERQAEEDEILARLRAGQYIEHYETVRLTKDGRGLDVSLSISPVKDDAGTVIGAAKIIRDITGRKQAEDRLIAATAKFESVFNQSGIFAGIMDLNGNLREVNDIALDLCGFAREQVIDRPFWETPWWRGSRETQERIRFASEQAAAGEVFRETLPYWVADGSERVVDFAMHPIRDAEGTVRFLHPTGIDITDRRRAEESLALLARLSAAVTPLVSVAEIATVAAEMIREHFDAARASFAELDRSGNDVTLLASAFAAGLGDDRTTHRVSEYLSETMAGELRKARTVAVADVAGDSLPSALAESYRARGVASIMLSPYFAGGRWTSWLSVGRSQPYEWRSDEQALLADVTVRVFNRIERARAEETLRALEAEEREIAVGLQRAMLPVSLVAPPGLAFGARYEAGSDVLEVGGDWYDAFALPSGRIALTVGDVVGHGLAAAAAMGQLRTALAALSEHANGPGELLSRLDGFLARTRATDFATVCYGVIDPATGVFEYASAGHLPILLLSPAGEPRFLEGGKSPPLYGDGPGDRPQASVVLEPGSMLVLYSDGLVERRGERLDTGLARLLEASASLGGVPIEDVCDRLVSALGVETSRDDDVAVLAVRLLGMPAPGFRRVFPARSEELRELRAAMRAWLDESAFGADTRHALILTVGEACANAIEHAYVGGRSGEVEVDIDVAEDRSLLVEVRDSGRFRMASVATPERGRGTAIMRGLSADFQREATLAGTTVRFRLPVAEGLPA